MYETLKSKNIYIECPICTKVFQVSRNRIKYRSPECRTEASRRNSRKKQQEYRKSLPRAKAICQWCGHAFSKTASAQRYCEACHELRMNGGIAKPKKPKHLTIDEIIAKMNREGYRGTYGKYTAEGRDKL